MCAYTCVSVSNGSSLGENDVHNGTTKIIEGSLANTILSSFPGLKCTNLQGNRINVLSYQHKKEK